MSYIGSSATPLSVNFSAVQSQGFNGTGSQTTFTLNRSVGSAASVEVLVNNVQQSPYDGSYNITGGTSLVFSEAPSAGTNNVYVVYRDQALGSLTDTGAVRKTGDTMTGDLGVGATPSARLHATKAGAEVARFTNSQSNGGDWEFKIGGGGFEDRKFMLTDKFGGSDNVRLSLDASGRVTTPYQPAFRASGTTTGAYSDGAKIPFTTVGHFDRGNNWNNSTSVFTAPVAGVYIFFAHIYVWNSTATGTQSFAPRVNNAQLSTGDSMIWYSGAITGGDNTTSGSTLVSLAAGDTFSFHMRTGAPSVQIYSGHSWVHGYLIG